MRIRILFVSPGLRCELGALDSSRPLEGLGPCPHDTSQRRWTLRIASMAGKTKSRPESPPDQVSMEVCETPTRISSHDHGNRKSVRDDPGGAVTQMPQFRANLEFRYRYHPTLP